ncbi:MAG: FtsX-like permease family protein [Gemmatimonadota bacterium]|nr:FtsX-like permease family protein [Gemmatimonadota bacterium]
MRIFIAIAWRNLWRNYQRTLIMVAGIAVGLFGLLVYFGISNAFIFEIVDTAIELELAHVQVNREGYLKNPVPANSFQADSILVKKLAEVAGVKAVSGRFKAAVLMNSAEKSSRVELVGVDVNCEPQVTSIASLVYEGEYIGDGDGRRMVLGGELARLLGVGVGDKIVVMAQDRENELQSVLFRVAGLFKSSAPTWDKMAAFITLDAMQNILGRQGELTSILIRAEKDTNLEILAQKARELFKEKHNGLEVKTWLEVSPILAQSINMFNVFVKIFYAIIYLAMAFGVVNLMLMAVLDRSRELGVMRAVGTTPGQVMLIVLLEAALLGVAGLLSGGSAAWLVTNYLGTHGLNLSRWASGMSFMGISSIIYPDISAGEWTVSLLSAEAAVIAASLWPAWRASRLKPVEAIRLQ